MKSERPILVLAGPTGIGKTAVAVEICQRVGGEIVGADSVQVYRGFDIGSAKPTTAGLQGVPHHLVDVLDADEHIDAAQYARLADAAIADVQARGRLPVVVGGTGLWLRALLRGLIELPAPDAARRAELEHEWDTRGADVMHQRLRVVDPAAAAAIHPNDRLRVVRALEVHIQTGKPLGGLRSAHALGERRYHSLMWVLDVPAAHHVELVTARTRAMWRAGFRQEVQTLLERFAPEARAFRAVGYREVVAHLQQGLSEEETLSRIVRSTLTYAKRQRTWFRGEPTVDERLMPSDATTPERLAQIGAAHVR